MWIDKCVNKAALYIIWYTLYDIHYMIYIWYYYITDNLWQVINILKRTFDIYFEIISLIFTVNCSAVFCVFDFHLSDKENSESQIKKVEIVMIIKN